MSNAIALPVLALLLAVAVAALAWARIRGRSQSDVPDRPVSGPWRAPADCDHPREYREVEPSGAEARDRHRCAACGATWVP